MCKRIRNMKVYISGKIGEEVVSEATRQKFAKAEEMLKANGYEVFNPCDERWQNTLKREYENDKYAKSPWLTGKFPEFYDYVLLRDLMVLSTKDAVYMLADWKRSEGATAEYHFALATGKKILFQVEDHAFDYLLLGVVVPVERAAAHDAEIPAQIRALKQKLGKGERL